MKQWTIIPFAAMLLVGVSCNKQPKYSQGLDMTNLDTSADPKKDFYQYACGGWMNKNPLTGEYSRYGSFDQLRENTTTQLQELVGELSKNVATEQGLSKKIGLVYNMSMDSATLNSQGYQAVKPMLDAVATMKSKEDAMKALPAMHHNGIQPFFFFYVAPDADKSTVQLVNIDQGGLNLPDRDYYLSSDKSNVDIRASYLKYVENMFKLFGFDESASKDKASKVMAIETSIAKVHFTKEQLREPKNNFNRVKTADLQKMFSQIDWNTYFSELSPNYKVEELNVSQLSFIQGLSKIVGSASLDEIKAYYEWTIMQASSSYLTDEIYAQSFGFYGKVLSGKEDEKPKWKRAIDLVESVMGEGLGEIYVQKYFPPKAKERMKDLVDNIMNTMKGRFDANTWMSAETKTKAKEKLSNILVKVGYPDKWRNYDKLEITNNEALFLNIIRSNRFDIDYMMSKLGKPVDRHEWQMSPQTVNAYYNPTTNEICFPAGILQEPFFYMDGDDAINYGAIGVVIAHELTHGFDDQGRLYDLNGNLKEWWTVEDAKKFEGKSKLIVDHFNNIIVIDSLHANGQYTLGENIADNGGLNISYAALQNVLKGVKVEKIDDFTPEQRFFLSYATVWACNIRNEEIRRLTMVDVHSLGKWRVNGTLPHVKAFLEAFDIKEGDPMWLAPEKRAEIW